MAAREDGAASPEAADQKEDETVAGTAAAPAAAAAAPEVDECSDDEADPVIRNLNLMSRRNLMPPEWIENRWKLHYEEIDLFNRTYDALENEDMESDYDETAVAECEEWSKRLWASVDFSGVNTIGGDSCGMDAEAVYPAFLYAPKPEEEEENHEAAAPAAEASS